VNKKLVWYRAHVLRAERTGARFDPGIRIDPDRPPTLIASYEAPDYRPEADLVTLTYVFSEGEARRVRRTLKRGEIPPLEDAERKTFISD